MAVSDDRNQHEAQSSLDENDLEQYGVWVKAGPEDVDENGADDGSFELADLGDDMLGADEDVVVEEIDLDIDGDLAEIGDSDAVTEEAMGGEPSLDDLAMNWLMTIATALAIQSQRNRTSRNLT